VRSLGGVVFFEGVRFVDFGIVAVLGHGVLPLFIGLMRRAHSSILLV
jgi:hypothetical protein